MIYVVMGMHKSGTTLVAKLVHHAGINMIDGEELRDYENDGFYERQSSYQMNLDLLDLNTSDILFFEPPSKLMLNSSQRKTIRELIETYSQIHDDWGFKDPRTCLTYCLWEQVLPAHHIIMIYRPIEDMWHRFQYTGKKFWTNISRSIALVKRWCEHNHRLLDLLEHKPNDILLLSYRPLMTDNRELHRLEHFLERPTRDVREKPLNMPSDDKPIIIKLAIFIAGMMSPYNYYDILSHLEQLHDKQIQEKFDEHII